jgi:GAF domain-containing protein
MNAEVSDVEKLSLLFELSRSFSSLIDLEELLPCIIAKTREGLQAESCSLLLLDEARQELYFPVISDTTPEVEARLKDIRFPAEKWVAGWVVQHGMPTRVPDVTRDDRWFGEVDRATGEHTRELLYATDQERGDRAPQ